jgi:hypothetical protein
VEASTPFFSCRNPDVYFLEEDAVAFLVQLRTLERAREGDAALRSIGEGSEAQECRFNLSATASHRPLVASLKLAKVHWDDGQSHIDQCCITFSMDAGDLLNVVKQASTLFLLPHRRLL